MGYKVYERRQGKLKDQISQDIPETMYSSYGTEQLGFPEMELMKSTSMNLYEKNILQSTKDDSLAEMVRNGTTDLDSDSNSSDSEDQDENELVFEDHAKMIWKSLAETIEKIDDMLIVDRAFMHGDVVGYVSDPSGQTGTVVNVHISVDLKAPGGEILKNVDSKSLLRVCPFVLGDYVICGSWLGRVDNVFHNVTIVFDNAAVCKIKGVDSGCLVPVSQNFIEDERCPYHPGQRVCGKSSSVFKNAEWLGGSWSADQSEGTIANLEVESVYVNWIVQAAPTIDSQSETMPAGEQDPRNLMVLSSFAHANWRLGDWCFLSKYRKHLTFTDKEKCVKPEGRMLPSPVGVNLKILETSSKGPNYEENERKLESYGKVQDSLLVMKTKTKVDIVWQDGTRSFNVDSRNLFPVDSMGFHDFWPEQFVTEKVQDDEGITSETKRIGIVKSVDSKERTVRVKWLKKCRANAWEFIREEIVSLYELAEHPDYNFSIGDIVIRISVQEGLDEFVNSYQSEQNDTSCKLNQGKDGFFIESASMSGDSKTLQGVKDGGHIELSSLSNIGTITGLEDGVIEVMWADGKVSKVGPQMVVAVTRDELEDDYSSHMGSEDGNLGDKDDVVSWGSLESDVTLTQADKQVEETSFNQNTSDIPITEIGIHSVENESQNSGCSVSFSQIALNFVARLAKGFFGLQDSNDLTNVSNCSDQGCEFLKRQNVSNDIGVCEGKVVERNPELQLLDPPKTIESPGQVSNAETWFPGHFKHFDCVKDPADHFFLNKTSQLPVQRQWIKRVHHEWTLLERNLPEGIYVKVYEDRMDLLRAVIVGAAGTPYHDGLFFFDIHLPPEYPRVPPLAHYHSGGLRLNPNLYENGKICLSLLNTWSGRGNEVWDPINSSILQVLVSLQGLVLNAKPYFNEAGYDKHMGRAEGEKNSLAYNENSFLLSCKSMLYLLRKPPKHFELFVKEHFHKRGCYIICACNSYMRGAQVGCLSEDATILAKQKVDVKCTNSNGFKIMLAKLLPKLISAFHAIDLDSEEQRVTNELP
eukprot:TRINITY_DN2470_c0_g1_i2.p1 TRINITY_DN2470_c0_g1~~TRINITY_DN2470_c0_g1_i2.p1  ORF type:complete len:1036 (-),score=238.51 TRINITY_DN2470_c0_g1_i2:197-3304(-)